jgi:protein involved in polysaccharide export with SLBB domain
MKLTTFITCALALLTATASLAQSTAGAKAAETNEVAAPAAKLMPMDKLQYRVQEDPAQGSCVVAVSSLGKVQFPVSIGFENIVVTVDAKGLTLDEVTAALKKQLEARYYKTATISLSVVDKAQKMGQAFFTGECRGVMPLPPGEEILLSSALIKLGYSEFANLKKVELYTEDKATGKKADVQVFNMDEVIKKGARGKDKDPILQDGDRVVVKQKSFVF